MKLLKQEVLAFISSISKRELRKNPDLRRKLKQLNNHLKDSYSSDNKEILKYLNSNLLIGK
ncbi:hypothetical protein [Halobacteriovorax sp. JY17]|uniref:hypothetical protein n=1 Tax=Halobacteriovorax sp. JY17 TaxID=2014617 RepID=UPI000C599F7E|nr:hypothetical protein [Halobacteriovorax sp. JY17]PIK13512.1 MAG: hypothetical protein CES88_16465 [Halobacteriovorax sp. JY17]